MVVKVGSSLKTRSICCCSAHFHMVVKVVMDTLKKRGGCCSAHFHMVVKGKCRSKRNRCSCCSAHFHMVVKGAPMSDVYKRTLQYSTFQYGSEGFYYLRFLILKKEVYFI